MLRKIGLTRCLIAALFLVIFTACSSDKSSVKNSTDKGDPENKPQQAQGVTDTEILVGHSGPQTGAAAAYDQVRQGIQSYFNYVNENGGVNGRKLKLIPYDDTYQPNQFVQNTKRLVEEDKVFALVGSVGTPNIAATEKYIEEKGIPLVGYTSGTSQFVNPPKKNFFSHLMNYNIEGRIFLDYLVNELGAKTVYISYQNDDSGLDFLSGINERINEQNYEIEVLKETPHLPTDVDFSSIAYDISKLKPDAVLMLSTPQPAAKLKQELHKTGQDDIPYLVPSTGGNDPNLFNLAGKEIWEGAYSTTSILSSEYSDEPSLKIFEERYPQDFPKSTVSGISQWGWGVAQIFVEAVERAGEDLTWENLITQLETMDNWDGSIYPSITYSPENRYGNTTLYITQAKDGKIVPISEQITYDPLTGEINYENK